MKYSTYGEDRRIENLERELERVKAQKQEKLSLPAPTKEEVMEHYIDGVYRGFSKLIDGLFEDEEYEISWMLRKEIMLEVVNRYYEDAERLDEEESEK